jgi:phospholipid/cholesterol/gamma-HCH transport system substrate-binding protein
VARARILRYAAVAGLVLVIGLGLRAVSSSDYTVEVVLPAATNLVTGSKVQISGEDVGSVKRLEARDGKAVVTVSVDADHAPLHDGTTAVISYKATMGERILELTPGDDTNRTLADGALVEGTVDRVELDQVLAALDAPTRKKLSSLVRHLSSTLDGSEEDVRNTLQTSGPAVEALGGVLQAVGTDGPAIRDLVTRLAGLSQLLADRDAEVSSSVRDLTTATSTIGARRAELSQALKDLPSTLDVARSTLDKVPPAVAEARPLLRDLRPAAERLPAVSQQLGPVLADLQPTIAELRPTLVALQSLLGYTPALLDGASSLVPQVDQVVADLGPALTYVRPYTPELAGWLSNWGSAASNYDANGHYLRAFVQEGSTSVNAVPGVIPPGITRETTRLPGESEGQPWTDAHGSEMQ